MVVVEVKGVTKSYDSYTAVDNVSFEIHKGEVFVLLGSNGSGKTSMFEMLVGISKPNQGSISVLGINPFKNRKKLAADIGVQLDNTNLPLYITIQEALGLFAKFHGVDYSEYQILETFGLIRKRKSFFYELSWGEKQRLGLALACIHQPKLLFLDEPTSRLDPIGRVEIDTYIKKQKAQMKSVFINTHDINEAERICDRIAIINRGQLVIIDTPQNLLMQLGYTHKIMCEDTLSRMPIKSVKLIRTLSHTHIFTNKPKEVINYLQKKRKNFSKSSINLGDIFLFYAGEEYHQ